jgi:hypothetical protein
MIIESKDFENDEIKWNIAKDAKDMYEEFNGMTYDGDIEQILTHLNNYRSEGLLILFLQVFHLYATRQGDSKSGNIFEWYKYEDTRLADFESVLNGVDVHELPGKAGARYRLWNLVTKHTGVDMTFPWGPQGDYETLVYYFHTHTDVGYELG